MLLRAYVDSVAEMLGSIRGNRGLLIALAKRDISDEYVEHSLSAAWPIIHPLVVMVVYLFVFTYVFPSRITRPAMLDTNAVIYLMAGIVPWITTAQVMGRSLTSVVNNAVIVKQMAFPLEFLPVKTLAGPLFFGGVALAFQIVYAAYLTRGECLAAYAVGIPILVALTITFLLGTALLFAAVQVFVRDFREFINIVLAVGLFVHPILYFPDAIPAAIKPILYVSPFTYLLLCWQDVLFYGEIMRPAAWIVTPIFALLMLVVGSRVFMVSKPHFGDFL